MRLPLRRPLRQPCLVTFARGSLVPNITVCLRSWTVAPRLFPIRLLTDFTPQGLAGRDDNVDFEATWDILATALNEIHRKRASVLSFEELYRAAYKLVLKKRGDELYTRVKTLEEQWLSSQVQASIIALLPPNLTAATAGASGAGELRLAGERFMAGLKDAYQDHALCMNMITDVLMYLVSGAARQDA